MNPIGGSSLPACSSVLGRAFAISAILAMFIGNAVAQNCSLDTIVHITDKNNQPVANVNAADLKAEIGGTPANITSLSLTKPAIVLVLDTSPSMKQTWDQAIAAAKQFVEKTEDVGLFTFREKVLGYAIGRVKSEEMLDQLAKQGPSPLGSGGTALYDTLIELGSHLKTHNAALVLISDGGDNQSTHTSEATALLFERSSWPPVFALILDYKETDKSRGYFKKIPAATGGMIIYPSSASKVPAAADQLAGIILNSFVLSLQAPESRTDMAKLKLESARKDINLLHVSEVPPCGPVH